MSHMKFSYQKHCFSILTVLFLGLCVIGITPEIKAQSDVPEWVEDPLKKPDLWKKLLEKPTDSAIWVAYYGKDWGAMSQDDLAKVNTWKQELMLRKLADNEAIIGISIKEGSEEGFFIDEAAFNEFEEQIETIKNDNSIETFITVAEIAGIEAIIMAQSSEMYELKSNISQNFVIIQDFYEEVFKEYGIEYVRYEKKHPEGDENQVEWVREHDKKLKKLKEDRFKDIKSSYQVSENFKDSDEPPVNPDKVLEEEGK